MNSLCKLFLVFVTLASQTALAEMAVPVQLRLKSPGGTYPTESGINIKLLVLSPTTGCVLREENFSAQTINNGNLSLGLGTGVRGASDPGLTLNQVYDNSKSKTGLACVDANNNIVLTGQTYTPAASDQRSFRISTTVLSDPIIVNFNMRATPYAIQAESVGGKSAAELVSNDAGSQMNQTNLIDLLQDVTRFNNLKSIAVSGQAASSVNFTGTLAGDVSGTQGAVSVNKIKGVAVSSTAPANGQILQYNGTQYVPVNMPTGAVTSVAGRAGAVTLTNADISGLGGAAVLNVGTAAGTVAAGNDSRIVNAMQTSTVHAGDVSGTASAMSVDKIKGVAVSATAPANNQVLQYNGTQYVPATLPTAPVSSVAGRTGAVTLTNADISGLGGAALLNVGTAAGTVAAGNDSRIVSALQPSSTAAGDASGTLSTLSVDKIKGIAVSATAPTSNQVLQYNGSQYVPATLPTAPVSSVAGRTGAVTLLSSDISGLGGAALLNVGTAAGTVAAGNDVRFTDVTNATAANTANTIVKRDGSGNFAAGTISATNSSVQNVYVFDAGNANSIRIKAPAAFSNYILTLPVDAGAFGQILRTDGTGALSWVNAGGGGSVNTVTATAPLVSTGGVNPNISLVKADAANDGYLSAADWNAFASKQSPLGYTPLNPASNLSDVASVAIARTNLGLGGAAQLNVGTAAGTVAAGDDARILGALSSSAFNAYVASASCSALQTMYWNSVSSTFACQNIPAASGTTAGYVSAADYSSFAAKQNALGYIPLDPSNNLSDIGSVVTTRANLGLGGAATLNVGIIAGTVAAGNDSRITGAVQVTTIPTCAAGQYLSFNGTTWSCNADQNSIPPVTSVAGRIGAVTLTNADISGLGGAAVLNVGTAAGTVAAGNDSRLTGAVQGAAIPTCVAGQYLSFNGTTWSCNTDQNSIPPVTSVAGRTGAVTLTNADISGLGGAAVLNVGTAAGTVAAGNDSRITGAVQGAAIPSCGVGQYLSFNGTAWSCNTDQNTVLGAATATSSGYLTASDWVTFNGKQNALGYVPLNAASNLSDLANPATARSNLSLGGAALLNVGTSNGTVAAGDDSRMVNAVQTSSVHSGDVSGTVTTLVVNKIKGVPVSATAPVNGDVLQYNGTQYVPMAIPSAPVSSVAGRTGAVVLSNADISGLGGAAVLNIGTAAGTVAAGDDSRIVNGLQPSSNASGDVTGTFNSLVVTKIRGALVSTTAPANGEVLQFNGTQYVPTPIPSAPVSSVAGRTGVVTLANTDIAGLGGAAVLNVGTVASTVAAGNDSRIIGALPSATFNGYVASSSCTTSQSLYWNSVSSQFLCQAISFPAAPVSSVAGRTGAVTLVSSDISGLGTAAILNVGVAAANVVQLDGTARIPASTLPTTALTTSTVHAGDVSGTASTMSVDKIKGVAVSATAPTSNQVLQYNGTQYVPATLPAAPVSSVAGRTGSVVLTSSDISGLGGAAILNVGTTAGTVAAGNDSRIVNAFQTSSALAGDISGTASTVSVDKIKGVAVSATAPTSNQVLQYNGTQYVPATLPAAPVTTVAGRTGAIVLVSSDISGLGGAAILNVGTTAGTVAAGNDSRIVNAVQTSTAHSGDVSGTASTMSVDKIKGVAVSATAPTSNQVLQYNGTQYVPSTLPAAPVSSVAGRTGAVVLTSSDISGLGGAAILNVGTIAGTVAAGNDSRITGALQTTTFNGYVASSSCTTSQSLYWNSVSSQFLCQAISFPAAPVSSVAGRTGAVTLVSSDISGLGTAAVLNVGIAATNVVQLDGTARIPASTLPTTAVTTSTVHAGDVSGTVSTMSVDKIKGTAVSATAPVTGQALVYNGTQWVPTTGFPNYARLTADQIFSVTATANVNQLFFPVVAGNVYKYKFNVMFTSLSTATGIRLGLTYPAATAATANANIAFGIDGTGALYQASINFSGDTALSTKTQTVAPGAYFATVEGIIVPTAAGNVQLIAATGTAGIDITILAGSYVEFTQVP